MCVLVPENKKRQRNAGVFDNAAKITFRSPGCYICRSVVGCIVGEIATKVYKIRSITIDIFSTSLYHNKVFCLLKLVTESLGGMLNDVA